MWMFIVDRVVGLCPAPCLVIAHQPYQPGPSTPLLQVHEIEDALAQPLGPNISAAQRAELERRADEMRAAAARLQRVSAVRGGEAAAPGPRLDTIESGKGAH